MRPSAHGHFPPKRLRELHLNIRGRLRATKVLGKERLQRLQQGVGNGARRHDGSHVLELPAKAAAYADRGMGKHLGQHIVQAALRHAGNATVRPPRGAGRRLGRPATEAAMICAAASVTPQIGNCVSSSKKPRVMLASHADQPTASDSSSEAVSRQAS
jgi:hypothetical protein